MIARGIIAKFTHIWRNVYASIWRVYKTLPWGRLFERFPWGRLRLLGISLTVFVVILVQGLPDQTLSLYYNANYSYVLTEDDRIGGSKASWLDEFSFSRFRCSIGSNESAWCSYSVRWPNEKNGLLDLSDFHSVRVNVKYVGDAKKLRIFMRTYHPDFGSLFDSNKNKFQSVILDVDEFEGTVTIPFREFVVADWWMKDYSIDRRHASPDFSAVHAFAIDFPQPGAQGEHVMEIKSIEFLTDYIPKESMYLALLTFWLAVSFIEGFLRYYFLRLKVEQAQEKALNLVQYAREQHSEKLMYKRLSGIDPLTGAYNRSGLAPLLEKSFSEERRARSGMLLVIDIDHFKRVNDQYGHSAGDEVIKRVAHTITDTIRIGDIFSRWGGEEFLLIFPDTDHKTGMVIGEKLRYAVQNIDFNDNGTLSVTVSVGVTNIASSDTFKSAFDRADKALYQAKNTGRNQVVFNPHFHTLKTEL